MGCDIHLHVERLTGDGWVRVPDGYSWQDEESTQADWADPRRWYNGRNYNLFAILADVRNGHGFAGAKTGEGFIPIDTPRGLPADVSAEVQHESDEWGVDGHSHSWFTVQEVLAYDWDQIATLTSLVNDYGREWRGEPARPNYEDGGFAEAVQKYADTYKELPPWVGSTCSGVFGPGAEQYKRITWEQTYYRCSSVEWWGTVARAARLAGDDPTSVRFVFWFDN